MVMNERFDIAIIGAGPGGYSTALRASQLGLKVALIERDATLGGTCLNRGCIPTKALLEATSTFDAIRHGREIGINAHVNEVDYGVLRNWKLHVVSTMTQGLTALLAHRGVSVFRGEANRLVPSAGGGAAHIVQVKASPSQTEVLCFEKAEQPEPLGASIELRAAHVVLALGSHPQPLLGTDFHGALIDSTQALALDEFPASAAIIGAGAVAVEFASMWNAAGVDITLLIRKDRVLSSWDRRVGVTLTRELKRQGIHVLPHTNVTRIDTGSNLGATVHYTQNGADGTDGEQTIQSEVVLGAIGRTPNTDADWLADTHLTTDKTGHITTDALGRTSTANIWATGDIVAGHALAHRAFEQGITVAEAIAGMNPKPVDETTVPQVVFSRPQAACVGLTVRQAKENPAFTNISETTYPMMSNARMAMSATGGTLTVVTGERVSSPGSPNSPNFLDSPSSPVVLGVHMVCPTATELIAEAAQLVGNHVPLSEAARLIHPHPTFSETLGEALLKADGRPLHTR